MHAVARCWSPVGATVLPVGFVPGQRSGGAGVGPAGAAGELLVGRDRELTALAELLESLGTESGRPLLLIAGEPGIGKSSLLRELGARAGARGHLVLRGRAAEFEGELPFGVFRHALDDWLLGLGATRRASLAAHAGAELAPVLPAFRAQGLGVDRQAWLQQERYHAYGAVRGLLTALAEQRPLTLVLDDVHWADPGSVELICHLLAHPPRGAVLVALGLRPPKSRDGCRPPWRARFANTRRCAWTWGR